MEKIKDLFRKIFSRKQENTKIFKKEELPKNIDDFYISRMDELQKLYFKQDDKICLIEDKIDKLVNKLIELTKCIETLNNATPIESQKIQEVPKIEFSPKIDLPKYDDSGIKETIRLNEKLVLEQIKNQNGKIKSLEDKFDGLLEIMSDKLSKKEKLPNIFSQEWTMQTIMDSKMENNEKMLSGIFYMMKKFFNERGISIR